MHGQPQNTLPLAALSPQERSRALERYRMLQPCIEHEVPLTHVARHHGIALRTAQRWLAQYRRDGFAGLARRERSDRGHPHGLHPELKQVIEGLALSKPPPTAALVYRQVRDVALRNGWPIPNYKRVYRVIKQLDPALVMLAHDGSKAYRTTYDLLYRREADKPNDIWQADHTLLDIWVRHASGPPLRPWLTVVMDDYSRAIAGFGLSFQAPSAIQTALILRQAIWRKSSPQWKISGVPAIFYTDHGSDFTSDHLEQVSADLEMALVFSEPGMPRGRGKIERFFRTVNQMLLSGLPGYTPVGLPADHAILTASAFEAELQRFILDQYHQRPHSVGIPGIEKHLSRYPQLYSRVGFVHAFRPLSATQVRKLLQQKWVPSGVALPDEGVADEAALAAIIRVTGGNFRLLHRLMTQIARLVEINALQTVTSEVVEAARESLVIGTS